MADFDLTPGAVLRTPGGAPDVSKAEWEAIEKATDELIAREARQGLVSVPDSNPTVEETAAAEVSSAYEAHKWVPPQAMRYRQNAEIVRPVIMDAARDLVNKGRITTDSQDKLQKLLNDRRMTLPQRDMAWLAQYTMEAAEQTYGKMWDKVLGKEGTAALVGNAMIREIGGRAVINGLDTEGPGIWESVWHQQQGLMRAPQLVAHGKDFHNLLTNYQAYRRYIEQEGYYPHQQYRGPAFNLDQVGRLYQAVTGATYEPVKGEPGDYYKGLNEALDGFYRGAAWTREKAKAIVPLGMLGIDVPPEQVDNAGRVPVTAVPFNEKDSAAYYSLLSQGWSKTNPTAMAEYKVLEELRDGLTLQPDVLFKQVFGTTWDGAVKEMTQEPNPSKKLYRFLTQINPDTYGPARQQRTSPWDPWHIRNRKTQTVPAEQNQLASLFGNPRPAKEQAETAVEQHGLEQNGFALAAAVVGGQDLKGKYTAWRQNRYAHYLAQQEKIPVNVVQALKEQVTPEQLAEGRRGAVASWNEAYRKLEHDPKQFFQENNWIFKQFTRVLNAAGHMTEILGTRNVTDPLVRPGGKFLMDHLLDPLPGDDMLVGDRQVGLDYVVKAPENRNLSNWIANNVWLGHTPADQWDAMYLRHLEGRSNFADDLTVACLAMRDFAADLPGALVEDPVGMWVLGKTLGKYSKGVKKVAEKAERAGLPRPMVAVAELAAAPHHPIKAMDTMFGVYTPALEGLNVSVGEFKRTLNRARKTAPDLIASERLRIARLMDLAEERGLAPNKAIELTRAAHADAMGRLELGQKLSWVEARDVLKAALELPNDLSRNVLPPPLQVPKAMRNPASMLWEADQVIADLEKMDNLTARQLKDYSGKTYAEHWGEAVNAWFTRPELFMPKRQAFYRMLEKGPFNKETKATLKTMYDKHVDWERALPAASEKFRDTQISMADKRQEFVQSARVSKAMEQHSRVDLLQQREVLDRLRDRAARLDARARYLSGPIDQIMQRENALRNYWAQETGMKLPGDITPEVIGELRAAVKAARAETGARAKTTQQLMQDTQLRLNKYAGATSDQLLLVQQRIGNATYMKGIEEGYRTPLTRELRQAAVERHMVPLLDQFGEAAVSQGVPHKFTAADAAVRTKLATIRGMSPKQRYRARVAELSKRKYWDVEPLAESHRNMVQVQRSLVDLWKKEIRADDVRFRIFETAMADKYPALKGAHVNEHVQGIMSSTQPIFNMSRKIRDKYWDRLSDKDRRLVSRLLTEPDLANKQPLTSHVMSMYFDMEGFRQLVLEESYRAGRISKADMQKYSKELYVERYFPDNVFAKDLSKLNYKAGLPPHEKMPVANRPTFNAFRTQRSSQFARVFYKDRKTGKILEHQEGVEAHGGAEAANKAAQQWLDKKINSGEIERHHAIEMGKKGDHVVKVMTDQELGGMGLISNNGTFRMGRLEELLKDSMKRRLINHVAQMRGMVRNPVKDGKKVRPDGVKQAHWGEWTEPLAGKEWGPLEGKMLHRSLIRTMNTLDQYGEMLQAVRDQFINETGAMKVMTGMDKALAFRFRELAPEWGFFRYGDKLLKSVYHNMIVKNWETWLTNHVGNWFSFALMGLNPARTTAMGAGLEFRRIHRSLAEFNLARGGGRPGMWAAMEKKFGREAVEAYQALDRSNKLAPTVGAEHFGVRGGDNPGMRRARDFHRKVEVDHEKAIARQRAELADLQKSIALIEQEVKAERLEGDVLQEARNRLERMRDLEKSFRGRIYRDWFANPVWKQMTGVPAAAAKETLNFVTNVDRSALARLMSEEYGKIDAMYKYMALRELRRQGVPVEQALTRIDNLMQNYNKVPSVVRSLKRAPIMGAMVPSFAYEAGRIMKNAFARYPGQALAVYNFPLIWNTAALAARGMSINDFLMVDSSENRAQAYMKLWSRMFVPTEDGMMQLYTGKYTFANVLEHPAGAHRVFGRQMQTKLDKALGAGPAMVMSAGANFFSNFFAANPLVDIATEYATGVDTFDRTVSYAPGAATTPGKRAMTRVAELFMPRTLISAEEELMASHEESPITGHQRTWFQTLTRVLTGLSLTGRKDSEAVGLMAIRHSRWEQVVDMYKRMKTEDQTAMRESAVRARRHLDDGDRAAYEKELGQVKNLIAKGKDRLIYHAGKWMALETTPEEIEAQAINYVGRDVLGVIQNVPIDKVPDFYVEMMLSGYRNAAPEAVNHIYRQMGDWHFVSQYSTVPQLRQAVSKLDDYLSTLGAGNPQLASRLETARFFLDLRLRVLEPKRLPAVEATVRTVEMLEAELKDDPVAKRRALQRLIAAENRMRIPK